MMRGHDDCCNLIGGRVGEKTVRKRRIHRIQYRQGNELEEKSGKRKALQEGKWSCASLASRRSSFLPGGLGKEFAYHLHLKYKGYVLLFIGHWGC